MKDSPLARLSLAAVVLATAFTACHREAERPTGTDKPVSIAKTSGPLPSDLAPIVEAYRKIIVLTEDETRLELDEQKQVEGIGLRLYQENHERLTALSNALVAEIAGSSPLPRSSSFLTTLEQSNELHDADKLVFAEVVSEMIDASQAAPANSPAHAMLQRLEDDQKALKTIEQLYDKELDRIFGRYETRGMTVRREAWESYVAFLRSKYPVREVFAQYAEQMPAAPEEMPQPETVEPQKPQAEINGQRLPPKTLVLTFDDGPHPKYTDRIREILMKYSIPAVFFEVGQNLATLDAHQKMHSTGASKASLRLLASGFTLANHSFTHPFLPKLSDDAIASQIDETNQMLVTVVNSNSHLFRPPYGARNAHVMAALHARGLTSVLWNIDSLDWADPIPQSIANRVLKEVEGEHRGIVLFHDIHLRTVEALPSIIETLQSRGYHFVGWNGSAFADKGGAVPAVPATVESATPAPKLYRESWAVVVGIDAYAKWPRLSYAANDARAMRQLLINKYGFKSDNITLLLNEEATREKILSAIGDTLSDPAKVVREDRVFVFFAGHGATRPLPNGRALGYIIPVDADLANYQGQAISMTNFQDVADAIPAKHVFFMTDSCYSGIAATRGGGLNYLQEITKRSARQILTAGGANEQVADNGPNGHSIFTWTVMQGLEGRADMNGDGFITASELAGYVGPIVSSLSRQTPAFASLAGSEGGEFIFELPHEHEYLSDESTQLDAEAITLNGQLDAIRAEIAAKKARNEQLRRELESAKVELGGAPAAPPASTAPLTAAQQNDRGTSLFREKHYDEALGAFLEAAQLNPKNALAANNVGFTYYKLQQHAKAIEWFERTLALDPRRAVAYVNLGDAYAALARNEDARRAYEKYLELQPASKTAASVRDKLQHLAGPG